MADVTLTRRQTSDATPAKTHRLTVCGSFGFGNAGDEAVPLAISDLVDSLGFDVEVDVLSRFDETPTPKVVGLGAHDEARRAALCGQPVLLAGGGVIEPHARGVLNRAAGWIRQASPPDAVLFGAAVEPGVRYGWRARNRLRRGLRLLRRVAVRDVLSAATLRELTSRQIDVVGDSVLWLRPAPGLPTELAGLDRYVAVTLAPRWADEPAWREWISRHLLQVADHLEAALVFVPCSAQFDDDRLEHTAVAAMIRQREPQCQVIELTQPLDPREVCAVFGGSVVTVGMRLHACVMAYAQRRPSVGLVYHPKLAGFADTVGLSRFLLPQTVPQTQSTGVYGYRFAETGLAEADLVSTVMAACERTDFSRLQECKESLAHLLVDVMEHAGFRKRHHREVAA